jgi:hypothetical protein
MLRAPDGRRRICRDHLADDEPIDVIIREIGDCAKEERRTQRE